MDFAPDPHLHFGFALCSRGLLTENPTCSPAAAGLAHGHTPLVFGHLSIPCRPVGLETVLDRSASPWVGG